MDDLKIWRGNVTGIFLLTLILATAVRLSVLSRYYCINSDGVLYIYAQPKTFSLGIFSPRLAPFIRRDIRC